MRDFLRKILGLDEDLDHFDERMDILYNDYLAEFEELFAYMNRTEEKLEQISEQLTEIYEKINE
jgi:flagellar capping protein FliD